MKRKVKQRFITATSLGVTLTMLGGVVSYADGWRLGNVKPTEDSPFSVSNYSFMAPSLTGTKMILQDPKLADKHWVEYVEYELYTEVQEGDIKYYIYQPTDYAASSIMAIRDYNPDVITGSSTNLSVSLGELGSIFESASLGSGISEKILGSSLNKDTIAAEMTTTKDIVKNSKYYATPSFMGIPGDKDYKGVSNDGYYNASSMSISMTKESSVQVTKTQTSNAEASIGSTESTSTALSTGKEDSWDRTFSTEKSHTDETNSSQSNLWSRTESNTKETTKYGNTTKTEYNSGSKTEYHSEEKTEYGNTTTTKYGSSSTIEYGSHTNTWGLEESNAVEFGIDGPVVSKDVLTIGANQSWAYNHGSDKTTNSGSDTTTQSGWDTTTNSGYDQTTNTGSDTTTQTGSDTTTGTGSEETQGGESSSGSSSSNSSSSGVSDSVSGAINSSLSSENGKENSATSSWGYGLEYATSQQTGISETVERTFSARDDDEVKNVGWKLCEYVVRVPYYIEAVKVNGAEETLIYSQYVTYDLLKGVSRVFANGYIEHWNTGELVPYADFFEGFITAQELVDQAKKQAGKSK